jgi:hypothetical protein
MSGSEPMRTPWNTLEERARSQDGTALSATSFEMCSALLPAHEVDPDGVDVRGAAEVHGDVVDGVAGDGGEVGVADEAGPLTCAQLGAVDPE